MTAYTVKTPCGPSGCCGGNHHPKAANKETINAEVSAGGSFEPKNGRVVASLSAGPPSAGAFSCPPGQRLVLASVSYTNIVLTDTTDHASTPVPDASRIFFAVQRRQQTPKREAH